MSVTSVLLDILIVLIAAKLAAEVAERIGFPPVVAEILAGVVIGPSVFDLDWAQEQQARMPNGKLVVIPGAGHSVQRRSADGAREAVNFLLS